MRIRPLNSKTIRISFGIATSLLAWISIASYWSTHKLVQSFDTVAQGHQAIGKFQHIETLMEAAESGVNDFVITGRTQRLEMLDYAKLTVPYELRQLDELLPFDSDKRDAYQALIRILSTHLDYLTRVVNVRKTQGFAAASREISSETFSKRDAMERLLSEIQQAEFKSLDGRWQRASEHSLKTKMFLALATFVSLVLVGWIYGLLRRESAERPPVRASAP